MDEIYTWNVQQEYQGPRVLLSGTWHGLRKLILLFRHCYTLLTDEREVRADEGGLPGLPSTGLDAVAAPGLKV